MKKKQLEIKKPVEPVFPDYKKFKDVNDDSHIIALKKYYIEKEQYNKDMELYTQVKFIKDIQHSKIELCLKKYKIVKI